MEPVQAFDVIIIGGSNAGLSAAMALGRSLRQVLIIDSGEPCNRQTPHSHNFLTHDGSAPAEIAAIGLQQVLAYPTVQLLQGLVTTAAKHDNGFIVTTAAGGQYTAGKLLLATGMKDIMPDIPGFAACWGISVLHCPYCHGYEVRNQPTGILANGDMAFEFCKLIRHWTPQLTLFTNGPSTLGAEQTAQLTAWDIRITASPVTGIVHEKGYLQHLVQENGSTPALTALYARPALQQREVVLQLGCGLNEHGFITVNDFQETTIPGVYAAGDNTTMFRAVSIAVAAGTKAGAIINKVLIDAAD
ncbi:MAG TPA: NAD(P)/FAD-dependent oxidoreductase [Chitinophaga sp.]|uniref:NAD(P)/FAD-dependent oxidoreductase n=1 Tax=Chitinophaga sp. TaxID=1869181 RepID=UPI002DB89578|nr:NAD(P)/FAD-dependent oxidoreductase [Chitinophaga sp.]HEU4552409.1 NAD(P)/FAD-dependent oxidoreductase [Chitinophaga sp.]